MLLIQMICFYYERQGKPKVSCVRFGSLRY